MIFIDIDLDFYRVFIAFLENKSYAPNTIGCRIKNLKTFLRNASESGLVVNQSYKLRSFILMK
ncbi:phage integrase SAM-like domain-containing protein [Dysgonomonas massiliensis]|uniref:phage integrase SAM-like domain-containing protein n=1 Tax=Dysgonomonas massiliensis TaxID=2040292 RepID=UPI00135CDE01